jgi:hypothetical protein
MVGSVIRYIAWVFEPIKRPGGRFMVARPLYHILIRSAHVTIPAAIAWKLIQ